MSKSLIPVTAIQAFEDEPRIRDLDLAERLGAIDRHDVRRMIERNREELEMHGELFSGISPENAGKRGRPAKAYWLNEGQALVICALSRTDKAATIRKALIDVFTAYRQGKLVHVSEHRRKPPKRMGKAQAQFRDNLDALQHFKDQPDAIITLLARYLTRLEMLEARLDCLD